MEEKIDVYEFLGVSKDATKEEIKKAYRKKSKEMHPDTGGDQDDFTILNEIYEMLMDDERRRKYDRTGEFDSSVLDPVHDIKMEIYGDVVMELPRNFERFVQERKDRQLDTIQRVIDGLQDKNRKIKQFIARKRKHPDIDYIGKIAENLIENNNNSIREAEIDIDNYRQAFNEVLEEYEFADFNDSERADLYRLMSGRDPIFGSGILQRTEK